MDPDCKRVTLTFWFSCDILEWLAAQKTQYSRSFSENLENAIQFALARYNQTQWTRSFKVVPHNKKCTTVRMRPDYALEIRKRALVTGETMSIIMEGAMWLYIKSMGTVRK